MSDNIVALQRVLTKKGFLSSCVAGTWCPNTEKAWHDYAYLAPEFSDAEKKLQPNMNDPRVQALISVPKKEAGSNGKEPAPVKVKAVESKEKEVPEEKPKKTRKTLFKGKKKSTDK